MRRKLAAGNWKMNGNAAALEMIPALPETTQTEVLLCPPAPLIYQAYQIAQSTAVRIGAQDCHAEPSGAYTGDISAEMIAKAGASYVIVGHSERRSGHGEGDDMIRAKIRAAQAAGLSVILCIGEDSAQRAAGGALEFIAQQMASALSSETPTGQLVIAYEPIWAIGSGHAATAEQISAAHDFIRTQLRGSFGTQAEEIRLLYGGSVNAQNATEIFACSNVDGALVGGASLTRDKFVPIIAALDAA